MFDRNGNDSSTYNQENIAEIRKTSPRVADLIEKEYNRQKNNVELIASENYCSEAVMAACGSCLSWKYAEGYPAKPIERLAKAEESDAPILAHLMLKVPEIAKKCGLDDGFRVVINNGLLAGETVPHLHIHILGGRPLHWPPC